MFRLILYLIFTSFVLSCEPKSVISHMGIEAVHATMDINLNLNQLLINPKHRLSQVTYWLDDTKNSASILMYDSVFISTSITEHSATNASFELWLTFHDDPQKNAVFLMYLDDISSINSSFNIDLSFITPEYRLRSLAFVLKRFSNYGPQTNFHIMQFELRCSSNAPAPQAPKLSGSPSTKKKSVLSDIGNALMHLAYGLGMPKVKPLKITRFDVSTLGTSDFPGFEYHDKAANIASIVTAMYLNIDRYDRTLLFNPEDFKDQDLSTGQKQYLLDLSTVLTNAVNYMRRGLLVPKWILDTLYDQLGEVEDGVRSSPRYNIYKH
jgi:hypothetical protein